MLENHNNGYIRTLETYKSHDTLCYLMVSSLNPSVNLCVYSMEIYTKDMLSKFIRDVYAHSCMRAVQLLYTPQTNSSRGCIG